MHCRVWGNGREGLDGDVARVLLVILEGVDDVVRLGLGSVQRRAARPPGVVDDEHCRGPPRQLDQVEHVDAHRQLLGRIEGFEEGDDGGNVSRGVDAHQNMKLSLVL